MKSDLRILIAFVLNLAFSLLEFAGGIVSGSVAILSDAVHDLGDALGIGIAYLLEKISRKPPNEAYPFGYRAYSTLGSILSALTLLAGSVIVIVHAVQRLITPAPIHSTYMLVFAVIGLAVNGIAALVTHHRHSHNQKAVFLHMLEDVLGWAIVLIGAVIIRFTGLLWIDPLLSIGVASYLIIHAFHHLSESVTLLLGKTPQDIDMSALKDTITAIDGVDELQELRVWSFDGQECYASVHLLASAPSDGTVSAVRTVLNAHGIAYAAIETATASCHSSSAAHML